MKICRSYIVLLNGLNQVQFPCERRSETHFECSATTPVGRIYWPSVAPLTNALDRSIESGTMDSVTPVNTSSVDNI